MLRSTKNSSRARFQSRRLGLEPLERREMLSIHLNGSELQILGTGGADTAQVYSASGVIYAELNGVRQSFKPVAVASVRFSGGDGNDTLTNQTGLRTIADGGAGNDRFTGGSGNDLFYGNDGDDFLDGMAGNDEIYAGAGNDQLEGGDGNDLLSADTGNDVLYGEAGADLLYGNDGADTLRGQGGADVLCGGNGNDILYGGDDADCLYGEAGADTLRGENGNDTCSGGDGADYVYGTAGDDALYGDNGDDHLYGGTGADRCYGGTGNDTLVSLDAASTDVLFGNDDTDSFWTDASDTVSDATARETADNLHRISSFQNGADRTLDGDNVADPTDGLNYKNFADKPLFAAVGPSEKDVDQNFVADCWLLAPMGSMAMTNPAAVYQLVVDLGDGTYAVRLDGNHYFRVDADLPTQGVGSWAPNFAGLGVDDCLWVAVVEKAYTSYRSTAHTYASIGWGSADEPFQGINATGADYKGFGSYSSGQNLLNDIAAKLDSGLAVTVGTGTIVDPSPLVERHEYTVLSVNRDATGKVISVNLRNPWGPAGAIADVIVTAADLLACNGGVSWATVD